MSTPESGISRGRRPVHPPQTVHPDMPVPSSLIAGIPVSRLPLAETLNLLAKWVASACRTRIFVCANPHSLEIARRDTAFAGALRAGDLVCADGIGVVVASRLLGAKIPERVCGPEVFSGLCRKLNVERPGTRMFFLGSDRAGLNAIVEKFAAEFPDLVVAGSYAPPFRSEFSASDDEAMISEINNVRTEVLWIGLGAPKQEKWAQRNRERLHVALIGPVGAVFDFYIGRIKAPPRWLGRFGGYSLYRLIQEPRRVGSRLANDAAFLARMLFSAPGVRWSRQKVPAK